MKLYLDLCCFNRPFDDQTQPRVRLEAEAVTSILQRVQAGTVQLAGGAVLISEALANPNPGRRRRVLALLKAVTEYLPLDPADVVRGQTLETLGFGTYDALHIACAERAGVDVLLTTDDKLERRATRHGADLHVRVANPLNWLKDGADDD